MHQSHCRALVALAVSTLACASAVSAAETRAVTVDRLSDRVLVASAPLLGRNNVTAIATRKGLVLVDAAVCPFVAGKLKQEIEKQLGRSDWAYVINTHVHDHTGGNVLFKSLPIIGHEHSVEDTKAFVDFMTSEEKKAPSVRFVQGKRQEVEKKLEAGEGDAEALKAELALWRGVESDVTRGFEAVAPTVRIADELTLDMGDVTIRAIHSGRGHSASDLVVYVPEEKLLVAGSACGGFLPSIRDEVGLADLKRSVAVFDRVLQEGLEHVVPSHADPGGRQLAEQRRDYYRDLLAGVASARGQGLTLEKAQETLGLESRFPYLREAKVFKGTPQDVHAANVAAVWTLLTAP
jgi:glyoxylase-like metal-dependent hydrolase (beta-lactamase superfamily II)